MQAPPADKNEVVHMNARHAVAAPNLYLGDPENQLKPPQNLHELDSNQSFMGKRSQPLDSGSVVKSATSGSHRRPSAASRQRAGLLSRTAKNPVEKANANDNKALRKSSPVFTGAL